MGATPDAVILNPPKTIPVHLQTTAATNTEPSILEIKCPYVAREMSIEQAASTIKNFYIRKLCLSFKKPPNSKHSQHIVKTICRGHSRIKLYVVTVKDGNRLKLNPRHDYYDQVQGQLNMTGTHCCDFLVWTTIDAQVIRIPVDSAWLPNIGKLIDFYFTKFIPSFE